MISLNFSDWALLIVSTIPLLLRTKFQRRLVELIKKGLLSSAISDQIRPTGSIRPRLYRLPKTRKYGVPSSSSCHAACTDILDPLATSPYCFIAFGRSSGLHPVSSHSCCMYVRAGRPAFARPYVGIHRSTSLMSTSLLLQQCLAFLVRLTWIVFVMGGRWPYSWCLVGFCRQELFNIPRNILV